MKRVILILAFLCLAGPSAQAQAPDAAQLDRYADEAQKALGEQRYGDAARAYEKLRELSPQTAEVHAQLGLVYFQQNAFAKAVPSLRQALKLKPSLPNVDILLAMCLSELGQFQEALSGLRKGFRQSADVALRRSSGLQLQRAYTGLEQDGNAVEVALGLTRLYPEDPEILYHCGRLFANYAYLTTMKLSRVAPASLWMHQAAGEANESLGLYDAAVRDYRAALALDSKTTGLHFRIGRALMRSQKSKSEAEAQAARIEASKEFEQELRLDPTNANAGYELGELHRQAGDLDRARESFEMAVKHYPDFEEAQIGLARVLITLGKPEVALPHLRKAISLNPANEVSYYQLFLGYRALGNPAEQQKALAEFQRLHSLRARPDELLTFAPQEVTKQELDSAAEPR
jgi:tetratricopeptide (TPR) repeat protein